MFPLIPFLLGNLRLLGPPQECYFDAANVPTLVEVSAAIFADRLFVVVKNVSPADLAFVPEFVSAKLFVDQRDITAYAIDRTFVSEKSWVTIPAGGSRAFPAPTNRRSFAWADTIVVNFTGRRPDSLEYLAGRSTEREASLPPNCSAEVPLFRATWCISREK